MLTKQHSSPKGQCSIFALSRWLVQCECYFPTADGFAVEWTQLGDQFGLPIRHHYLLDDIGAASEAAGAGL